MNIMIILVLLAIVLIPVLIEVRRSPMDAEARKDAPGKFVQLSKGLTHCQWYGPSRGPVLVCVHGLTTPSFVWKRLVPGIALLGFRVLVYDLYGRGYSDKVEGPQDRAFFVNQLVELLEHEGIGDEVISIMGYSMGGCITAAFAAEYPERISRIILLAPAGCGIELPKIMRFIRDVPVIGDWLMLAIYPATFRKGIAEEGDAEIGALQENELTYKGFIPAVLRSFRGILSEQFEEEHRMFAEEEIPMMAIWGAVDDVVPITCMDNLSEWNPDVQQVVLDEVGHDLAYSHPDRVLLSVSEFLANR